MTEKKGDGRWEIQGEEKIRAYNKNISARVLRRPKAWSVLFMIG